MSHPPDAKFLGFLDKDASDEEIAAWLQNAIAQARKAEAETAEDLPPEDAGAAEVPDEVPDAGEEDEASRG